MKKFWIYSFAITGLTLLLGLGSIPQLRMAAIIGTGIGTSSIQSRVNRLHRLGKAGNLNEVELIWMRDLYFTLAVGAKLSLILPASSKLMFHYLDGTGEPLQLKPKVFRHSDRVIAMKAKLNRSLCEGNNPVSSVRFDMGGRTPFDSSFALYFGILSAERAEGKVTYTVDMPWKWPTYQDIKQRYGSYEREIFPIPNAASILNNVFKIDFAKPLYLPNALGGELERFGLAKGFKVTSGWSENLEC